MSDSDKMLQLVKELAELRREIVQKDTPEEGLEVKLTGSDLAAIVYALALSYVTEWVNGQNGHRKVMGMLGGASATILSADVAPHLDGFLDELLGENDAAA